MGDLAAVDRLQWLLHARTDGEAQAAISAAMQEHTRPICNDGDPPPDWWEDAGKLLLGPAAGWVGIGPLMLSPTLRICIAEWAASRWWVRAYTRVLPRTCLVDLMAKREDTGRVAAALDARIKGAPVA